MKDITLKDGEALEVTYGEMLVGVDFNPAGDDRVNRLKALFAEAIDIIDSIQSDRDHVNDYVTYAIHKTMDAQMSAVKCLFLK